jgi:hypothetical protein
MAGIYNLYIDEKETFQRTLTWNDNAGSPVPMSGWTAKLQIRAAQLQTSTLYLTLDNAGSGGITLNATNGQIGLTITPAQSELFPTQSFYDLVLTNPNVSPSFVFRLVQGEVWINPAVTV